MDRRSKKEIKNFEVTVEKLLNTITIDNERSNILREFGTGEALRKRVSDAFTYIKFLVYVKAFVGIFVLFLEYSEILSK
ncbi:hypothetical protein F8M41_021539 [Gigaspora margarita]|uniref:Uncharacterized protein n=1 Tax=Gigaspora margarita TaxID=4874 RepID=A0A8H4AGP3_GIGMA|nr:hypothetical protein F8M41_021539 [Gigaspora margarita]